VLARKLTELESQGAGAFFGEPAFDIHDLLRTAPDGRGVISILELSDVQDRPRLFSTFLMWLLAELYEELPERGDADEPLLVFFFDEAHYLFDDASKALTEQITQVVRLIRSKGIGIFFVTQTPRDVPAPVLEQLGNRVQHALRAFTPNDAKALKATVSTFPITPYYDLEETLTTLAIGEAVVSCLSESGSAGARGGLPDAAAFIADGAFERGGVCCGCRRVCAGCSAGAGGRPGERAGDAGVADRGSGARAFGSYSCSFGRSRACAFGAASVARPERRKRSAGRRRRGGRPRRALQVRDEPPGAGADSRGAGDAVASALLTAA
jgi:hypothetical protein